MKEVYRKQYFVAAVLGIFVALSGCTAPTVPYQPVQSATLRVMNFAPNCQSPVDVYWHPTGDGNVGSAKIINLRYGQGSIYSTSLNVAQSGTSYDIIVRPTRDTIKQNFQAPIQATLQPNSKYTLLITTDPSDPNKWVSQLLTDAPAESADPNTHAFIRFANMQQGVGALTIRANDPALGDAINATPTDFNQVTSYVPITLRPDTNYAFYVVNSQNKVLYRLTGQTFAPGSFWTLAYGGDSCDIDTHPEDAQRLRIYDDNTTGNDQTSTIPSFRYNIVNAVTPVGGANFSYLGFLVNSEGLPQLNNLSMPPVPVGAAGGAGFWSIDASNNFWAASYQTGSIPSGATPNQLPVSAFISDQTGANQTPLFNAAVNLPAGDTNRSVSIVFYDTVMPNSASAGKSVAFLMPDTTDPNSAILVFVPAVFGRGTSTKQSSLFYYQLDGNKVPSNFNSPNGATTGSPNRIFVTKVTVPSAGSPVTIVDSVWAGGTNRIPIQGATFNAVAGGIYEIVSHGDPNVPSTLGTTVIQVNSKPKP